MPLTPQQLIDLPGYGAAEKVVRAQKQWDEGRILDGKTEYKVTVEVSGSYEPVIETQCHTVTAKTADEAIDAAMRLSDFDDVDSGTVIQVKETQ